MASGPINRFLSSRVGLWMLTAQKPRWLWLLLITALSAILNATLKTPLLATAACLWPARELLPKLGMAGPALCGLATFAGLMIPRFIGLAEASLLDLIQCAVGGLIVFGFAYVSRREARAMERARVAAGTDMLTGLLNRKGFLERLTAEAQRARLRGTSTAVAYLDCDTFKQFNDTHGHLAGDHFLTRSAATMKAAVRLYDSVGRLGGDEFAILLPEVDSLEAEQVALRLRDALQRPAKNQPDEVTWTIGLAIFPTSRAAEEMLDQADKLMLAGKRASRGGIRVQEFTGSLLGAKR